MTTDNEIPAVYTCQNPDCGKQFEDRWDARKRFCPECAVSNVAKTWKKRGRRGYTEWPMGFAR